MVFLEIFSSWFPHRTARIPSIYCVAWNTQFISRLCRADFLRKLHCLRPYISVHISNSLPFPILLAPPWEVGFDHSIPVIKSISPSNEEL